MLLALFSGRVRFSMMVVVLEYEANSVYAYKQVTKQRHPKAPHASQERQQTKGISSD
jgi:hypothetical protein